MTKNWISIHIFYYGDQNMLLIECIAPLIDLLRGRGLIRRYFFIKYWVEGRHLRLRLLPTDDTYDHEVRRITEATLITFLKERPALYTPPQQGQLSDKALFLLEYGEDEWQRKYGESDSIPLRPNNTFAYIPYEPEYQRYGGVAGVELAEQHFEFSSDIVIKLLREINVTVPTILLGISIQLTLPFFYSLFDNDQRVITALDYYIRFWEHGTLKTGAAERNREEALEKKYQRMAPALLSRVSQIRAYMREDEVTAKITATELAWKNHLKDVRKNINTLFEQRQLVLADDPRWAGVDEFTRIIHHLQGSYVHMTNNRLGVLIAQEVYLGYLLKRSLEDLVAGQYQEAV